VVDFAISPDGDFVAYKADQEVTGKFELFAVPVTGGVAFNLSRRSTNILEVKDFAWAPDSSRIAFRAQNDFTGNTGGNIELYTNTPDAGSFVTVSNTLPPGGDVAAFEWSPLSQSIAFSANPTGGSPNQFFLFVGPPNFPNLSTIISVIPTASNAFTVSQFDWSPNGTIIAYLADINFLGANELLAVDPNLASPQSVPLSGSLEANREVTSFQWAPDSSRIVFLSDIAVDEQFVLTSVVPDIADPFNPQPDPRLISDSDLKGDVIDFQWAPDSSRIAYIADQDTIGKFELFTNDPLGTDNQKVSGPIVDGGDVIFFEWEPVEKNTNDIPLILYLASQEEVNRFELFTTTPVGGGGDKKVSDEPMAGTVRESGDAFAWSPDTESIAYIASQDDPAVDELFTTIPDPLLPDPMVGVKISGPLAAGGNVEAFRWSPDSEFVAYRADQDTFNVFELYASKPDGSENQKLSGDLLDGGQVTANFAWVP